MHVERAQLNYNLGETHAQTEYDLSSPLSYQQLEGVTATFVWREPRPSSINGLSICQWA